MGSLGLIDGPNYKYRTAWLIFYVLVNDPVNFVLD